MKSRVCSLALITVMAASAAAPLYAQSLADVARKEEERRKTIKEPAKVYTNDDVGGPKAGALSSAPDAAKTDEAGKADKTKTADEKPSNDDQASKDEKEAGETDPTKGPAYWHGKMQTLQTQLERDQSFADALQVKINALTTDFVNRDDPAQKAIVERDRNKSLTELDRLKKAIVDDKKAIADLEEDARRAGVPPGWLR